MATWDKALNSFDKVMDRVTVALGGIGEKRRQENEMLQMMQRQQLFEKYRSWDDERFATRYVAPFAQNIELFKQAGGNLNDFIEMQVKEIQQDPNFAAMSPEQQQQVWAKLRLASTPYLQNMVRNGEFEAANKWSNALNMASMVSPINVAVQSGNPTAVLQALRGNNSATQVYVDKKGTPTSVDLFGEKVDAATLAKALAILGNPANANAYAAVMNNGDIEFNRANAHENAAYIRNQREQDARYREETHNMNKQTHQFNTETARLQRDAALQFLGGSGLEGWQQKVMNQEQELGSLRQQLIDAVQGVKSPTVSTSHTQPVGVYANTVRGKSPADIVNNLFAFMDNIPTSPTVPAAPAVSAAPTVPVVPTARTQPVGVYANTVQGETPAQIVGKLGNFMPGISTAPTVPAVPTARTQPVGVYANAVQGKTPAQIIGELGNFVPNISTAPTVPAVPTARTQPVGVYANAVQGKTPAQIVRELGNFMPNSSLVPAVQQPPKMLSDFDLQNFVADVKAAAQTGSQQPLIYKQNDLTPVWQRLLGM